MRYFQGKDISGGGCSVLSGSKSPWKMSPNNGGPQHHKTLLKNLASKSSDWVLRECSPSVRSGILHPSCSIATKDMPMVPNISQAISSLAQSLWISVEFYQWWIQSSDLWLPLTSQNKTLLLLTSMGIFCGRWIGPSVQHVRISWGLIHIQDRILSILWALDET